MLWEDLGISGGTALVVLVALYFVIKWAVKNGVMEACEELRKAAPQDGSNQSLEGDD